MKILRNLIATMEDAPFVERRGLLTAVHNEAAPGFFRQAQLGGDGLVLQRGSESVVIPIEELFKLGEAHCEALRPPTKSEAEPEPEGI